MKIRPQGAELFHADGKKDVQTWRSLRQSLCEILRTRLKTTEKSTKLNSRRTTLQVNKTFYFPLSLLWTSALRKHRYVTVAIVATARIDAFSVAYTNKSIFPPYFPLRARHPVLTQRKPPLLNTSPCRLQDAKEHNRLEGYQSANQSEFHSWCTPGASTGHTVLLVLVLFTSMPA